MQIVSPALEKVQEIASARRYQVLPVSCEILSDFTTPIEAMRILKNVSTHCYMLESAARQMKPGDATPSWALTPNWRSPVRNGEMKARMPEIPHTDGPVRLTCVRSWRNTKAPVLTISLLYRRAGGIFFL